LNSTQKKRGSDSRDTNRALDNWSRGASVHEPGLSAVFEPLEPVDNNCERQEGSKGEWTTYNRADVDTGFLVTPKRREKKRDKGPVSMSAGLCNLSQQIQFFTRKVRQRGKKRTGG